MGHPRTIAFTLDFLPYYHFAIDLFNLEETVWNHCGIKPPLQTKAVVTKDQLWLSIRTDKNKNKSHLFFLSSGLFIRLHAHIPLDGKNHFLGRYSLKLILILFNGLTTWWESFLYKYTLWFNLSPLREELKYISWYFWNCQYWWAFHNRCTTHSCVFLRCQISSPPFRVAWVKYQ